jgi:predicted DNA-binding transcriptional regulator YafY
MRDIVTTAISNLKRLKVWYEPGLRILEPHAFGEGAEGQLLLRAFQTEGASASGEHHHWKLFRLDRVKEMTLLDQDPFEGPRDGYVRGDRAMKRRIIAQL